jgi:hypothetical protein
MATQLGATNGVFGIPAQQTGIITDSVDWDYQSENKVIKNISGDRTGITFHDETCKISIGGSIPASSPFATTISAVVTLITVPTDHLIGSISAGLTIIMSVKSGQSNEDYRKISFEAEYSPTLTA